MQPIGAKFDSKRCMTARSRGRIVWGAHHQGTRIMVRHFTGNFLGAR
jgi:hypothetical protein